MHNPLEVGGVDDYPVKVGSMLLTLVDPNPGFERAYNRWYERDHYYGGCMVGPWLFAGSRWVATRPLKDLRWPADEHRRPADRRRQLRGHLLGGAGTPPRTLRRMVDPPGPRSLCPRAGLPRADPRPHLDVPLRGHRLPRRRPGPRRTGPRPGLRRVWSSSGGTQPSATAGTCTGTLAGSHLDGLLARLAHRDRLVVGALGARRRATRARRWTSDPLPAGPTGWSSCCSWTGTRSVGRPGPGLYRRRRGGRPRLVASGRPVPTDRPGHRHVRRRALRRPRTACAAVAGGHPSLRTSPRHLVLIASSPCRWRSSQVRLGATPGAFVGRFASVIPTAVR